jgi:hypothetical protein
MKMLEDYCATEPVPTRDWLAAERAKVMAAIGADGQLPQRHATRFRWPVPPRTALAGAAIAAVTAVIIALVVPPGHSGRAARQAGVPQAETAAFVIGHTEAALSTAAAENPVVHVRTLTGPKGHMVLDIGGNSKDSLAAQQEGTWYYGANSNGPSRTQGFTAAGQPVFDWGVVQTPRIYTSTIVDYQARTWWREVQHVTPWAPTPTSALTCSDVESFAVTMDPAYWAADIKKALSCGEYTTSGTEHVDGVNAIKLTPVRPGAMTAVLWVDPSTYLPVRVAKEFKGRQTGQVEDVQWLPPTAANLANLTTPIPAGFVQVPPPSAH